MRLVPALAALVWKAAGLSARAQVPEQQNQGSGPGYEMLEDLRVKAKAASDAGDAELATRYASELLAKNTDASSWNYGNVVYEANQILGLAALKKGDIASAKRYLIAAGKTRGSPQLDSFGPEMTLAQGLLAKGEKDTVLEFLDLVAIFWARPKPGHPEEFAELLRQHAATIEGWKAEIRAGRQPTLDRFSFPMPAWSYALLLVIAGISLLGTIYQGSQRERR